MGHGRKLAGVAMAAVALAAGPMLAGAATASSTHRASVRALDDDVRLNQIQVVGSHNSYHDVPTGKEYDLRHGFLGDADEALMYKADPLTQQFQNDKVRQIELDAWMDTAGGRYATPLLRKLAGSPAYGPAMKQPGIKVFHVQDVDYKSTCLTLKACLGEVKAWSDAHPTHVPLAILMELKDDELHVGTLPIVQPEPWDAAALDVLDTEIRSVFDPSDLITPDDVRGTHPTLDEAVTTDGWPTLAQSRGKVMFLMDNGGQKRADYRSGGHDALQGRVLFTNASPGDADAGFVQNNDSSQVAKIQQLVTDGYVVRTRADEPTTTARENDTTDRDNAFESGAQWVSTDFPRPGMGIGFTSPYFAEIPGGTVARCNPVNAPESCDSALLDTNYTPLPPPTTTTTTSTSTPGDTTTSTTSTVPSEGVEPAGGATPVGGSAVYTG